MGEIGIIIPLTIALTEAVKRSFKFDGRFIPMVALVIGVGLSYYFATDKVWGEITLNGLIAALSAMGLWSGGKAITGK